jgi:Domain of unknown function (DUF4232)
MSRVLASLLVLVALAGCGGSGAHDAGPVPTATAPKPTSTSTTVATASTTGGATTQQVVPLCSDRAAAVAVDSQQGAAGTIRTVWRVRNTSGSPCRSFGYPGMDFHAASGWLDVRVHRGGFPDINGGPAPVELAPGRSLFFVSYWGDVDTDQGPCREFDSVKVTLPDNFAPARLASAGCLDPSSVDVGPVSATRPS